MPVPGVTYNQYTFYMRKDRGILGGASVGQKCNFWNMSCILR